MERKHSGTEIEFSVLDNKELEDTVASVMLMLQSYKDCGVLSGVHDVLNIDYHQVKRHTSVFLTGGSIGNTYTGNIVAKVGGYVVGFLCWSQFNGGYSDVTIPQVQHIMLAPSYRGRGVAHRLLELFKAQVSAVGCDRYLIGQNIEDKALIRHFEKEGSVVNRNYLMYIGE